LFNALPAENYMRYQLGPIRQSGKTGTRRKYHTEIQINDVTLEATWLSL